ncbi:KH domain-containing, RNA-binding, signal transduction-associated protein 3 [Fukomys damarensis]|uniref:KH domain-containing, RNA-binding, signal transduction-associated protein 3 n=1 Tax=Fukomys damarensis TaxID=885580 RepID=A0A091DFV7_FUKDA|nr:KH domain-containing, RNA-binding, signal transduction-associated protein 3 [Fukomys damarensis]
MVEKFLPKLLAEKDLLDPLNSLKRLQEETLTKMFILGKGSVRDKAQEEECRKGGEAKCFHFKDDLHVLFNVFAPPAEAYACMGHALEKIKKFIVPDCNDEIGQAQLQELTYLNGG